MNKILPRKLAIPKIASSHHPSAPKLQRPFAKANKPITNYSRDSLLNFKLISRTSSTNLTLKDDQQLSSEY
jgi:hypothetical protein